MNIFKKAFTSEDSKFLILTGLKVVAITLLSVFVMSYFIITIIELNNIFFEANGYPGLEQLRQAFQDNALSYVFEQILPWFFLYLVILFFAGMYLGMMLLRPFDLIGKYCTEILDDEKASYNPDLFSDFRILTRFSELFFSLIADGRKQNKLSRPTIPEIFTKIHSPVFDRVFFFHVSLIILILTIISFATINVITIEIHEALTNLAIKTINAKKYASGAYFISHQKEILDRVQILGVILISLSYFALSIHLYTKVSGAAFGFFSTMRSFIKGNYNARVHLIGYSHIRPQGRALNKFLDTTQKKFFPNSFAKDSDSD